MTEHEQDHKKTPKNCNQDPAHNKNFELKPATRRFNRIEISNSKADKSQEIKSKRANQPSNEEPQN